MDAANINFLFVEEDFKLFKAVDNTVTIPLDEGLATLKSLPLYSSVDVATGCGRDFCSIAIDAFPIDVTEGILLGSTGIRYALYVES